MKRMVCFLLILLVMTCCVWLPTHAQSAYIYDQLDYFYDYEEQDLSDTCQEIETAYGVAVYYATVTEELTDFDCTAVVGDQTDYILFVENQTDWSVVFGGAPAEYLTETEKDQLFEVYSQNTISYKAAATACLLAAQKLVAQNTTDSTVSAPVITGEIAAFSFGSLTDQADLLTPQQETDVLAKMTDVGKKHNIQVAVVTVDSLGGLTPEGYAKQVYDSQNMGYGQTKDGVLLLVAMTEGKYYILTNGLAAEKISNRQASEIGETFAPYLTNRQYAQGFEVFAESCDSQLSFPLFSNLLIGLAIGLLVGLIVTGVWYGQLKSVRSQKNATVYTKQGSMNITMANDFYLYSTVTRKAKPQQSSSSGGSSGGSSRGGASGSF